eukprot:scaffold89607_cov31-Tisochrysis_lutea.AAC.1
MLFSSFSLIPGFERILTLSLALFFSLLREEAEEGTQTTTMSTTSSTILFLVIESGGGRHIDINRQQRKA